MINIINKSKELIKGNKNFIIVLLSTTIPTLILILFMLSNINSNENNKSFNSIANEVNKINSSLEFCANNLTSNIDKCKKTLTNNITNLKEIQSKLDAIEPNSKEDQSKKQTLQNTLSDTISLYDICIYVINNPNETNFSEKLNELHSLKEKCIENYKVLTEKNIPIAFSDSALLFFDNTFNYINSIIKVNREMEIKNSQQRDFLLSLSSFSSTLDNLTENLTPAIEKIREDGRSIQSILDDLSIKRDNLTTLKSNLYSLSVPDGFIEIYDSLSHVIKIYDIYLASITDAVIYEKVCPDKIKYEDEVKKNYKNASSKYDDVLNSYSNFKQLINNL